MRIMIAHQDASFRLAFRMFLQTQADIVIVAESARTGELLRDAPRLQPDLIFMDWNLVDFESFPLRADERNTGGEPTSHQMKAVVISSLHHISCMPVIVVTGNHQDDLVPALYAGADQFLYQGDIPAQLQSILQSLQSDLE